MNIPSRKIVFILIVPTSLFDYICLLNLKHDKELVIQKGVELFRKEGYEALGVNRICKATGMTKGAFYNAFESKENFLLLCLSKYSEKGRKIISDLLARNMELPAIQRLQNFYVDFLQLQTKVNYSGCLLNNTLSELGNGSTVIGKAADIHLETILTTIEPTVIEAQNEGDITQQLASKKIVEILHLTLFGVLTQAKGKNELQTGTEVIKSLFGLFNQQSFNNQ